MTGYTFNQLFDFTRTTAGTFVGSNGLIQTTPASVNLLTFTQEFDNAAWVKAGATVSANTTIAPDGTATADKMVETATTAPHAVYQVFTYGAGLVYAATVYAKKAERNWIYLGADTAAAEAVFFDLDTGTVGSQGTGYVGSITNAGDGWYRCTVITTQSTALPPNFLVVGLASANGTPSYAGNGTSGAFIWGAQLQLGSTATTYARNNGGLFPPRFEYDPVTLAPRGILIEEQRTNLLLQSNAFTTGPWGVDANTDFTANSTASPDGAVNAWKMAAKNGLVPNGPSQFFTKAASAITYTASIFSKAAGYDWLQIAVFDGTNGNRYWFNVRTGAVGTTSVIGTGFTGVSASVTPAPNGFFRCSVISTSSTATSYFMYIYPSALNGSNGAGNASGDGVFVYGAQVEAGAFATSYIPTVASQVTRTADVCTISAPMFVPWYNQGQGTFVVDYRQGEGTTARSAAVANDGTNNNTIELYVDGSTDATALPFYGVYVGGAVQAALSFAAASPNSNHKMAGAYSTNDFAASVDGSSVATDTSGTLPTPTRLSIGANGPATGSFTNGHIRRVQFYPFRASNNQLQALST